MIQSLLERFIDVYKSSSREKQKQLLQLLVKRITLGRTNDRQRHIDKVELEFDFMEVNLSKTFTLIHMLYLETEKEGLTIPSVSATSRKYPPYLQPFLPLFVVRFTAIDANLILNYLPLVLVLNKS